MDKHDISFVFLSLYVYVLVFEVYKYNGVIRLLILWGYFKNFSFRSFSFDYPAGAIFF